MPALIRRVYLMSLRLLFATLFIAITPLSSTTAVYAARFPDVPPGSAYYEAIEDLAARGIFRGFPDGLFRPTETLARCQIAVSLVRAMTWGGEPVGRDFPDQGATDNESWSAIRVLEAKGVVRGYPDGTFQPEGTLTRQQAIAVIARAMIAKGAWTPQSGLSPYADVAEGHQAEVATYTRYAGAVPETGGGSMDAGGAASRGWYALALWQALRAIPVSTPAGPPPSAPPPSIPPAAPAPTPAPAPPSGGPPAGAAVVFYVAPWGDDGAPGSEGRPWRTLRHAASQLTAGQLAVVEDGTYTEGSVDLTRSGRPDARITIRARNPGRAVLRSTDPCKPKFSVGASYVTIEGMAITQAERCGTYNSNDTAVRCWSGSVGCWVLGVTADNMTIGVKVSQDQGRVEGSAIRDTIEVFGATGAVIRGNEAWSRGPDGYGIYAKGGARDIVIEGNTVHSNGGNAAIMLGGSSSCCMSGDGGYEGYNQVARNNTILYEGGGQSAFMMAGCRDCAIVNNTVVGGSVLQLGGGGPAAPTLTHNPRVTNNSFSCQGSSFAPWGLKYTGGLTLTGNRIDNCGDAPGQS